MVANRPGSLLVFPIGDVAQHAIANLCFFAQNGYCVYDDVNRRQIPGLERFRGLVDVDDPLPLTFLDQYSLTENTAELSTACYAGALMQQALGLGGWMFNGIDRLTILGASGDPEVPGLRFRYDEDERWSMPNPTGRDGVFAAFTPPHFPTCARRSMHSANESSGPADPSIPIRQGRGSSPRVRAAAASHPEPFRRLVATQAQYVYDTFGNGPPRLGVRPHVPADAPSGPRLFDALFAPGANLNPRRALLPLARRVAAQRRAVTVAPFQPRDGGRL